MFQIHLCETCIHCRLYRVEHDPTGKFDGAVDENGYWYRAGDNLKCSLFPAPFFPRQRYGNEPTKCSRFVYDSMYRSEEEWMKNAVIMKPNAPKEDVAHDKALGERIRSMVHYDNCNEDIGRIWMAEGDPLRQAMLKGNGNEVCRLLGIDDRFRLYSDTPSGPPGDTSYADQD